MDNGSFIGSRPSQWNGISFAQWAVRIKHYDWFGFEGPTIESRIVGKFTGAGGAPGEHFDWSMPLKPSR